MKKIQLGLDIGTQFCSACYADTETGDFTLIRLADSMESFPTECAIRVSSNGNKYMVYGDNAVTAMKEYQNGKVYILDDDQSLKTTMRNPVEDECLLHFWNIKNEEEIKNLDEIMTEFLQKLKERIAVKLFSDKCQITKIIIAYPDINDGSGSQQKTYKYRQKLKSLVGKVFEGLCGFSYNGGVNVETPTEAQCAADLLKKIYFHIKEKNTLMPQVICTVDIGAGTTDIATMIYNERQKQYDAEWYVGGQFGGKCIDKVMYDYRQNEKQVILNCTTPEQMIVYKKWMTDQIRTETTLTYLAANKTDLYNFVKRRISGTLTKEVQGKIGEALNAVLGRSIQVTNATVVLMGGSSPLPWIKEKVDAAINSIKSEDGFSNINFTTINLNELAQRAGLPINNDNFMAVATAKMGLLETTQSGEIKQITTNYNPFTYAIEVSKENKEKEGDVLPDGYVIIAHGGDIEEGSRYYWPKNDASVRMLKKEFNFYPFQRLYRLDIKEERREEIKNKDKISDKECCDFILGTQKLTKDDFCGYFNKNFKEIPDSAGKSYHVVTRFDNDRNGQLYMYIYGTADHNEAYPPKDQPDYISYDDFRKRAGVPDSGQRQIPTTQQQEQIIREREIRAQELRSRYVQEKNAFDLKENESKNRIDRSNESSKRDWIKWLAGCFTAATVFSLLFILGMCLAFCPDPDVLMWLCLAVPAIILCLIAAGVGIYFAFSGPEMSHYYRSYFPEFDEWKKQNKYD